LCSTFRAVHFVHFVLHRYILCSTKSLFPPLPSKSRQLQTTLFKERFQMHCKHTQKAYYFMATSCKIIQTSKEEDRIADGLSSHIACFPSTHAAIVTSHTACQDTTNKCYGFYIRDFSKASCKSKKLMHHHIHLKQGDALSKKTYMQAYPVLNTYMAMLSFYLRSHHAECAVIPLSPGSLSCHYSSTLLIPIDLILILLVEDSQNPAPKWLLFFD